MFLKDKNKIGKNVHIGPNCHIVNSTIKDNTVVYSNTVIEDCEVGAGISLDHSVGLEEVQELTDGSELGNFVEANRSKIGKDSKAKHLTYLGDARLGQKVNVGAGTITCNYDGKNKHKTIIEDGTHRLKQLVSRTVNSWGRVLHWSWFCNN